MLRYIMRFKKKDCVNGLETEGLYTIDGDAELVEKHLLYGGTDENCYEHHSLIGVELIDNGDYRCY